MREVYVGGYNYVFIYRRHLVHTRRLAQRHEPSSPKRTRGFIHCAGVGHKVMVTGRFLSVSFGLAMFHDRNSPHRGPILRMVQSVETHSGTLLHCFGRSLGYLH